jgi:hypothetical protein
MVTMVRRLVFLAVIILLACCAFVYAAKVMSIKIYPESSSHTDEPLAYPNGSFVSATISKGNPAVTTVLTNNQLACGVEGNYYADIYADGPGSEYDANGASCDIAAGDYNRIYDCLLYSVDYDDSETFCKQGNDGTTTPCFGSVGGIWEPAADNGLGECCGDDIPGSNPDGTNHDLDDPDMGKNSCEYCPVGWNNGTGPGGGLRDWSNSVHAISDAYGCCGDDYEDCGRLVSNNRYLCWDFQGQYSGSGSGSGCTDPNPENCQGYGQTGSYTAGIWYWTPADSRKGKIFNVSCLQVPVASNGVEWVGCVNDSFHNLPGASLQSSCVYSLHEEAVFVEATP